jgi:hypothetical protein
MVPDDCAEAVNAIDKKMPVNKIILQLYLIIHQFKQIRRLGLSKRYCCKNAL